jgi:hypothetical protein
MKWVLMLVMLSGPAMGQSALDIDYEGLLKGAGSRDQIKTHGVTLKRKTNANGSVTYSGHDRAKQGAVGCWMTIATHAAAVDRKCKLAVDPKRRKALNKLLGGIARFYAKNNVPVSSQGRKLSAVRSSIEAAIRSEGSSLPASACRGETAAFAVNFINGLSAAKSEQDFQKVLGPGRLPVSDPCF